MPWDNPLHRRLPDTGVYVFTVAPGFVETDMAAEIACWTPAETQIRNQSPVGRVARPEEVARTIVFLASPGSEFLTGGIVDVNGASYLRYLSSDRVRPATRVQPQAGTQVRFARRAGATTYPRRYGFSTKRPFPTSTASTPRAFEGFRAQAAYFRVVSSGGEIDAFLIGFRPGATYAESQLLLVLRELHRLSCTSTGSWWRPNSIAAAGSACSSTRTSSGSRTSARHYLAARSTWFPPTRDPLAFHERFGFSQVATQETDGGAKTVSLMVKRIDGGPTDASG